MMTMGCRNDRGRYFGADGDRARGARTRKLGVVSSTTAQAEEPMTVKEVEPVRLRAPALFFGKYTTLSTRNARPPADSVSVAKCLATRSSLVFLMNGSEFINYTEGESHRRKFNSLSYFMVDWITGNFVRLAGRTL